MSGLKRMVVGLAIVNVLGFGTIGMVGCSSTNSASDEYYKESQPTEDDTQTTENSDTTTDTDTVEEEATVTEVEKEPETFTQDGETYKKCKYTDWELLQVYERTGEVKVTYNGEEVKVPLDADSIELIKKINYKIAEGRMTKFSQVRDGDTYIDVNGGFPDNATWYYINECYQQNVTPQVTTIWDLVKYDKGMIDTE